mmetsp:Transcript_52119/g.84212  ORF Transcript_52119/g.84212 Transcript_52119/m.84212 type:complete len:289 (+) Transcript_52119:122-988(+)
MATTWSETAAGLQQRTRERASQPESQQESASMHARASKRRPPAELTHEGQIVPIVMPTDQDVFITGETHAVGPEVVDLVSEEEAEEQDDKEQIDEASASFADNCTNFAASNHVQGLPMLSGVSIVTCGSEATLPRGLPALSPRTLRSKTSPDQYCKTQEPRVGSLTVQAVVDSRTSVLPGVVNDLPLESLIRIVYMGHTSCTTNSDDTKKRKHKPIENSQSSSWGLESLLALRLVSRNFREAVGMHMELVIPRLMLEDFDSKILRELAGRYSRGRLYYFFLVQYHKYD